MKQHKLNTCFLGILYLHGVEEEEEEYLSIENKEERMVWCSLSPPLKNILYVQELKEREGKSFNKSTFPRETVTS